MTKIRYFRNRNAIGNIEPDSLWRLSPGEIFLILANDDEHHVYRYTEGTDEFYEIPDPVPPSHQPIG